MKTLISVIKQAYQPIFEAIGRHTLPYGAEQCQLGDWWLACDYTALPKDPWGDKVHPYFYVHTYQKIEQDIWGVWKLKQFFLGKHSSLYHCRQRKKDFTPL